MKYKMGMVLGTMRSSPFQGVLVMYDTEREKEALPWKIVPSAQLLQEQADWRVAQH